MTNFKKYILNQSFPFKISLGIRIVFLTLFILFLRPQFYKSEYINPCSPKGCEYVDFSQMITPEPTVVPIASKSAEILYEEDVTRDIVKGLASYYSWNGCLGCNENRIMANGEQLDDEKLTCAYNRAPLNSFIVIKNVKTGLEVTAKVTDRGGFERHGKIIDLSVGTKNAIGCGDVCSVEIRGL